MIGFWGTICWVFSNNFTVLLFLHRYKTWANCVITISVINTVALNCYFYRPIYFLLEIYRKPTVKDKWFLSKVSLFWDLSLFLFFLVPSANLKSWAQLFEGWLALTQGSPLTGVCFSFVQKHFSGKFSRIFL